jgi:hypothetical protein
MRKITFLFYCVTLLLCVTTLGYCEGMEKYFLLTENGINNHTYSEYKSAPAIFLHEHNPAIKPGGIFKPACRHTFFIHFQRTGR